MLFRGADLEVRSGLRFFIEWFPPAFLFRLLQLKLTLIEAAGCTHIDDIPVKNITTKFSCYFIFKLYLTHIVTLKRM